jgi:hypothetical protein
MKTKILITIFLTVALLSSCKKDKTVTDWVSFEELTVGSSGYWNGSDRSGGFTSGNVYFVNHYNSVYSTWSGFAYSSVKDTVIKDYTNQYSSVAKGGAEASEKFGIFYFSGTADTIFFTVPEKITEISFSNSVYAYHTIKSGNQFSKKFGGATGNDQDWFKLTITAINENGVVAGTGDLYLADFRSADNSKDYIANIWSSVDLSSFGYIKALKFELSSSDTGQFGMNTPGYVCIDNIRGDLAAQ